MRRLFYLRKIMALSALLFLPNYLLRAAAPAPSATASTSQIARTEGKDERYEVSLAARLEGDASEAAGSTLNIRNAAAATIKVRSASKTADISIKAGQTVRLKADLTAATRTEGFLTSS